MTETAQQTAKEGQKPKTFAAKAFAAQNTSGSMAPYTLQRREPRPQDVQIEILYCGVCHSDLHQVKNEWVDFQPTVYPCVPGHEIVGRVVKVGSAVKKFKEGDIGAVGCMVDSDRVCENCRAGEEQYCIPGATFTYNSPDVILGGVTYGGYSQSIVVDEAFVLRVPDSANLAGTAPLFVRRNYHVFADAALESEQGAKSGSDRARRARAHGHQIREGLWRAYGALHHVG